ncbi:pentapeptide repeat-containing protein [Adonisia turfae]|nr:pentapeptide repeat-containing protein [Adonisia turfae]
MVWIWSEHVKAAEVLRLYKAGERNFKGVNLKGQNFKGKDLSGVDFSGADIRSTNFTNANLTNANFTQAKAGLQGCRAIGLVVLSWAASGISAPFIASASYFLMRIFSGYDFVEVQVMRLVLLVALFVYLFVTVRQGIVIGAFLFAFLVTPAVAVITGIVTTIQVGNPAGYMTEIVNIAILMLAVVVGVLNVVTATIAISIANAIAGIGAVVIGSLSACVGIGMAIRVAVGIDVPLYEIIVVVSVSVMATLLSTYFGWQALNSNQRDAWIPSFAIAFAAIGGTSFREATLTNANFSQACLKSTDFRRSVLLRTRWREAIKLDRVRPGETYLNNSKIRELVLTGNGQGQSYENLLNLAGINLRGANLVDADFSGSNLKNGAMQGANLANTSFIGTNLNCAYLQDADLSNAKLAQAQLDEADLTGSTLTGACIEDWNVTTRTKLNGIRCDYVFMRLLSDRRPDQNPHRKPDDWNKTFADGEFVDFIAPMIETLDLYHNQAVDPRAVAIAFSDLRQQNPNADLEIISMEKRGQNLDKFNLRVRTSPQADLSQLHHQYFDRYEHLLTLPPQALIALLMEKEEKSQMLAGMIGTAISRPGTHINTYQNQGDTTVSEQGSNASKYNLSNAQFAGGFAETVQGNMEGGTINNQAAEKTSLAKAAAEIQALLKQLEQTAPAETMTEKMTLATQAIAQIESNPTFKQRAVVALSAGGMKAFEKAIDHPVAAFVVGAIEEWKKS